MKQCYPILLVQLVSSQFPPPGALNLRENGCESECFNLNTLSSKVSISRTRIDKTGLVPAGGTRRLFVSIELFHSYVNDISPFHFSHVRGALKGVDSHGSHLRT